MTLETLSENASSACFPTSQSRTRNANASWSPKAQPTVRQAIARRFLDRARATPTTTAIPARPMNRIPPPPRRRLLRLPPSDRSKARAARVELPPSPGQAPSNDSEKQRMADDTRPDDREDRVGEGRPERLADRQSQSHPGRDQQPEAEGGQKQIGRRNGCPGGGAHEDREGQDGEEQGRRQKGEQQDPYPSREEVRSVLGETVPHLAKAPVHADRNPVLGPNDLRAIPGVFQQQSKFHVVDDRVLQGGVPPDRFVCGAPHEVAGSSTNGEPARPVAIGEKRGP